MIKWIKKYLREITGDTYTFVGLLIAYATLTGSAQLLTGYIIVGGLVVWLLTIPLRDNDD